jgi:polysaccharide deacetylase 2 family uncharacterized protein YibQ
MRKPPMAKRPTTMKSKVKRASLRKKPSSTSRKKKTSSRLWPFLGLIGLFLVLGLIFYYLYQYPQRSQSQLNQKIEILDKTIHSRLFKLGFSKKDVISRHSLPRKRGKLSWRASTIKLQLPKAVSFPQIKTEMKRDLTQWDRNVRLRFIEDPSKPQRVEVQFGNLLTHNLIFYPPIPKKKVGPRVAIIIDDLGSNRRRTRELINLEAPITLSFFPLCRYSPELAKEASENGKEVIMHMPMEPYGFPGIDPGKGALLMGMNETELYRRIHENLEAIPDIKGVNNHMGSRFMENDHRVGILMKELKARNLFFLDSRTTSKTVGYRTAKKLGVKTGQRDVFLDNNSYDEAEIRRNIAELAEIAKNEGKAIGIGHPHRSTIRSLREMIPRLQEGGIEIVPLSDLMD